MAGPQGPKAAQNLKGQRPISKSEADPGATGQIREGLVTLETPPGESVFFNPAQVFNRDLSLLVLKAFACKQQQVLKQRSAATLARCKAEGRPEPQPLEFVGFNVLEPLAATGLRSLRYLKELGPLVACAVANDLDPEAAAAARANAKLNEVPQQRFLATCSEATRLMHLLSHPPLSAGTLKKINSLPAGASVPSSFDLSCPPEELLLVPPLFKPAAAAPEAAAAGASAAPVAAAAALKEGGAPFWFDVVDIDPYGSCSPFLDSAVGAVRSGGLLCVTSTDTSTLVGNALETAYYKYGGATAKMSAHHEVAVRVVLHAVAQAAAKQRKAVQPLLSLSVDFYVRLFVRVVESPEQCKQLHQKEAMIFHCPSCEAFTVAPLGNQAPKSRKVKGSGSSGHAEDAQGQKQVPSSQGESAQAAPVGENAGNSNSYSSSNSGNSSNSSGKEEQVAAADGIRLKYKAASLPDGVGTQCSECGGRVLLGGPIYSGRYYDPEFVDLCLEELDKSKETLPGLTMQTRIRGMLTALREELPDVPLHYQLPSLCTRNKLTMIKPASFMAALRRLGYRASHFHRDPQAVKTDAQCVVVFDILRTHAAKSTSANHERFPVLRKPIQTKGIDLSPPTAEENKAQPKKHVARWLPNPAPYWGPKGRAGKRRAETEEKDTTVKKNCQKVTVHGRQEAQSASSEGVEAVNTSEDLNPLL